MVRTNIVLDDNLVAEAFELAESIHTKRELIEVALREFVTSRKVKDLREIQGRISFDNAYDYKVMRTTE
jgi:Arc/MetJ family transcription regulator